MRVETAPHAHHFRFHAPHAHLASVFGTDWFGLRAERFARFFGTPTFLLVQTVIVAGWITANAAGWTHFDVYPFILLNLAFSLQAAYAAPLILLAETRQADRDKATADADARHREELARTNLEQATRLMELLERNTELTRLTQEMSARISELTDQIHRKVVRQSERP